MENQITVREDAQVEIFNSSLPVTQEMIDGLKQQRKMLTEFVQSQLRSDIDYGIIPGTKKPSLYKAGAEKLRGLFGLNITLDNTFQQIDRKDNFAMFTYKATVFRGDLKIAECEGSTNSQEKKYKERKEYEKGKASVVATPVCDILNTLQKMAQKRAFVGAVILACGASDFFTQDIDDPDDARQVGTIPNEKPSSIPGVKNVTSKPVQNNQTEITVEALVSYDEKQMAIDSGFKWSKDFKKWLKTIRTNEMGNFPFEVKEV